MFSYSRSASFGVVKSGKSFANFFNLMSCSTGLSGLNNTK